MRSRLLLCVLFLLCLPSCIGGGYDLQRLENDRLHYQLAVRLADGWFTPMPFSADDVQSVRQALGAWASRLDADARLLGDTRGGGPR